jgi:hypothetical protein
MSGESVEFFLPLGLSYNGATYRRGKMRPVTTGDELEAGEAQEAGFNPRYRDILLLARVIEDLEGISPLTPALIEELYEADFLYLQLLYRQINDGAEEPAAASCPRCGGAVPVSLPRLYENRDAYKREAGV